MNPLSGHVDAILHAAPLRDTGNYGDVIGHQLAMGSHGTRIYITPAVARQWIETLTPIAEESK